METRKEELEKFKDYLKVFNAALTKLESELAILGFKYAEYQDHNEIYGRESRIKKVKSIANKLEKQGLEFTLENVLANLTDVVGTRIICLNKADVYAVVDLIRESGSLEIVKEKDYIACPKDSGYRSFHMIVNVPVAVFGIVIPCEIQIRTFLQHYWSVQEHQIGYKNVACTPETKQKLKELADHLAEIEDNVDLIRAMELQMTYNDAPKKYALTKPTM